MTTEDANNSVADVEDIVASPTDLATEDQPSDEIVADETTDPIEDNQEDEGEEIEYAGKKYVLPKELKDGFMMREDYTRKTQELSETRKQFESERQAHAQRVEAEEAFIDERATVKNLEHFLRQYDNVDWDAAEEQNPELAAKEWRRMTLMQQQLQGAKAELQTKIDARLKEQHSAREQALQETGKVLTRDIPGFGPEMAQSLVQEAAKYGFTQEDMLNDPDPRAWKMVHALWEANRNKTKQAAAQTLAKQATTAPIKVVGAKSAPVSALSDKADTKAWMEARMKQVRAK